MAFKYKVANRVPLTLQKVVQSGAVIATRVSSSAGTIAFDTTSGAAVTVDKYLSYSLVGTSIRHAAMISPVPGETFIALGDLRFVASGYDVTRFGGVFGTDHAAIRVEFYLDDTKVLIVNDVDNAEFNVFKGRATGIIAGTYQCWCRAIYQDLSYLDSRPFQISVVAAPSYGSTVNLNADINWSSGISFIGSSGSRIRINGNGFRWIGNPTSINCQFVDFFNFGASSGFSGTNGIDINTTGGNTNLTDCRFFNCTPINIVNDGTSTVTVARNLLSSNSRVPLGQNPASFTNDVQHDSWPCLQLGGNSSGAKTYETNNAGAGWVLFSSANWTIGGTSAKSNINMGPRVGFFASGAFSGNIKLNYSHHFYFGGWSQGSNFELGDTLPTVEHNVIIGSSWPNRGIDGVFKYNLVLGVIIEEGLLWTHTQPADIHHNIFRVVNPGRGIIYAIGSSVGVSIRNNLIDSVQQQGQAGFYQSSGSYTVNSCLFANSPNPAVQIDGGTLTADYNGFYNSLGAHYSDGRSPTHDIVGNPGFLSIPTEDLPIDLKAVWERTLTVNAILTQFRNYYKPTNAAFDAGDVAIYGANNPIGPICRAGVPNASDLFGTL